MKFIKCNSILNELEKSMAKFTCVTDQSVNHPITLFADNFATCEKQCKERKNCNNFLFMPNQKSCVTYGLFEKGDNVWCTREIFERQGKNESAVSSPAVSSLLDLFPWWPSHT